ncbi:MAG: hypothetical protein ACO1O1_09150 [Adhaeribacter sp.]
MFITMAKHTNKPGIAGLSGSPGNFTFHPHPHRVVAYVAPAPGQSLAASGLMAERTQFQQAHKYARSVQHRPEIWDLYLAEAALRRCAPLGLAIADYIQPPVITDVWLGSYRGQPGDAIRIQVSDTFRVASVQVAITNGDGEAIERGQALFKPATSDWLYETLIVNLALPGSCIRIEARDLPGNCTSLERTLA